MKIQRSTERSTGRPHGPRDNTYENTTVHGMYSASRPQSASPAITVGGINIARIFDLHHLDLSSRFCDVHPPDPQCNVDISQRWVPSRMEYILPESTLKLGGDGGQVGPCRGHRTWRCAFQTGGQNKFHQPTARETTW